MSDRLRAVVVGVGHLGQHHARILAGMEDVELVGIVDSHPDRLEEVASRLEISAFGDASSLVDKVDFAVIATPTKTHREVAAPFLKAGKACLIEKPLAADSATCSAILADAQEGGAMVGVGHVERFNPAVRRAMELGIEPRFIEAHRLAPYTFRSTDVGVALDLMIHDVDLCLAWIGEKVVQVDSIGGATLSKSEDVVSARLRFANGAVANLTASRLSLSPMRRFRVFGPDCYVTVDSAKHYALLVRKTKDFGQQAIQEAAAAEDPKAGFARLLDVEELELPTEEPLAAELAAFADAVRNGIPHLVSGQDGMAAVEVIEQVQAAFREHSWGMD